MSRSDENTKASQSNNPPKTGAAASGKRSDTGKHWKKPEGLSIACYIIGLLEIAAAVTMLILRSKEIAWPIIFIITGAGLLFAAHELRVNRREPVKKHKSGSSPNSVNAADVKPAAVRYAPGSKAAEKKTEKTPARPTAAAPAPYSVHKAPHININEPMKADEIIWNMLSLEEIESKAREGKINEYERKILVALQSEIGYRQLLMGEGIFRLYPEDEVNTYALLQGFYSLHKKVRGYYFYKLLENGIALLAESRVTVMHALRLLEGEVNNEADNRSEFKIKTVDLLKKCRELIKDPENYDRLSKNERIKQETGNEEGWIGIFREYNKTFKLALNFDLFDFSDEKKPEPARKIYATEEEAKSVKQKEYDAFMQNEGRLPEEFVPAENTIQKNLLERTKYEDGDAGDYCCATFLQLNENCDFRSALEKIIQWKENRRNFETDYEWDDGAGGSNKNRICEDDEFEYWPFTILLTDSIPALTKEERLKLRKERMTFARIIREDAYYDFLDEAVYSFDYSLVPGSVDDAADYAIWSKNKIASGEKALKMLQAATGQ